MIGIFLLVIPLVFLVIGIIYFSVSLWKLMSPIQELSSQGMPVISPEVKVASSHKMGVLEKEIFTINTQALSDEDDEFLYYAILKSHDKVVEMHNVETRLEVKKSAMQERQFLKMPPIVANEVAMTRSISHLKSKGELIWARN